jgi:hypothetical protein
VSTIIIYKRNGNNSFKLTDTERMEGMKDAGEKLREELAKDNGASNDSDADDRIKDVLDWLFTETNAAGKLLYAVRFEENQADPVKYKLDGQMDERGRYLLKHPTDPRKNGRLRLDVGLDDRTSTKKIFKMRLTVPKSAADTTSWTYLSDDINADLVEIAKEKDPSTKIENYLISTFMFSRCR